MSLVPAIRLADCPVLSLLNGRHRRLTGTWKTYFLQGVPSTQSEMAMPLSLDLMAQGWWADGGVGGGSRSSHHGENGRRDEQATEPRV